MTEETIMSSISREERVARAICWALSEETDDCSSVCLNAKRCMAEKVSNSCLRDARAAIAALSPDERLIKALTSIATGSKLGAEMFEQRVKDRKGRLTWYAVNVLQDNLDACRGTATRALSTTKAERT